MKVLISKSEFLNKFQIPNSKFQTLELRVSSSEFEATERSD